MLTVAIDQVSFHQNTTPVPDEMLAHRLGMVPLISRDVTNGLRYTRVSHTLQHFSHNGTPPTTAGLKELLETTDRRESRADQQDCECDEGCYYCMVILKLKASYFNGQQGQFMSVTSDMLEIVPSPGGVSRLFSFAGQLQIPVSRLIHWSKSCAAIIPRVKG